MLYEGVGTGRCRVLGSQVRPCGHLGTPAIAVTGRRKWGPRPEPRQLAPEPARAAGRPERPQRSWGHHRCGGTRAGREQLEVGMLATEVQAHHRGQEPLTFSVTSEEHVPVVTLPWSLQSLSFQENEETEGVSEATPRF